MMIEPEVFQIFLLSLTLPVISIVFLLMIRRTLKRKTITDKKVIDETMYYKINGQWVDSDVHNCGENL
jgi:hypothetical protein